MMLTELGALRAGPPVRGWVSTRRESGSCLDNIIELYVMLLYPRSFEQMCVFDGFQSLRSEFRSLACCLAFTFLRHCRSARAASSPSTERQGCQEAKLSYNSYLSPLERDQQHRAQLLRLPARGSVCPAL